VLTGRPGETVVETMLPRTVQELEAGLEAPGILPAAGETVAGHLPESTASARPTGPTLRARVAELVKNDPEHAAEVLRMWLKRG
jgi:flagellar biosynthesis/type III secretory pathway M-ring protein FliF/YscJ